MGVSSHSIRCSFIFFVSMGFIMWIRLCGLGLLLTVPMEATTEHHLPAAYDSFLALQNSRSSTFPMTGSVVVRKGEAMFFFGPQHRGIEVQQFRKLIMYRC